MSFVKIWIHLVFGTKERKPLLTKNIRYDLIKYIKKNSKDKNIFIDCIDGYEEHLHCLISLGCEQSISKVVNLVKGESSYWINKENITKTKFEWANEYFAVSVSESAISKVRDYIMKQEEHHRVKSFTEECNEFINKYGFKQLG